jgi:hypothetical protein
MNRLGASLLAALLALAVSPEAFGQEQSKPQLDDITISPSRQELVMPPGTERTVTIKLKAGTLPNSACPWLIYTPSEMTVEPGNVHVIRVTVSVPKDATPGDHLAVLFVEPRLDDLKTQSNTRQVQVRFRMGAIFYVMVPGLTQRPSLENLKAESSQVGILVTPKIKNEGNSHVRPTHSVVVTDRGGAVVAELAEVESLPVLAGSELEAPVLVEKSLPEGSYSVLYRVKFGEGETVTEGMTDLVVKKEGAQKGEAGQKTSLPTNPAQRSKHAGGPNE